MAVRARMVRGDSEHITGEKRFPLIDTRTLVVASGNESTLILFKNAILELLTKYPAEFDSLHCRSCAALVPNVYIVNTYQT